jgi:predicted SnoaL-like aldol condensation-catalyzing enzyme
MDSLRAARKWIDGWKRAWPANDASAVAAMYGEDAVYSAHPFKPPHRGRAAIASYAAAAFRDEPLVRCWFGEPVAKGSRATVEYWAIVRSGAGEVTVAGSATLRFDDSGLVVEHRDYWTTQEGRIEPPQGWGA